MTDAQAQELININASTNAAIKAALDEVKAMRKGDAETNTAKVVAEAVKQAAGSSKSKKDKNSEK